jgi:hypothetical protein
MTAALTTIHISTSPVAALEIHGPDVIDVDAIKDDVLDRQMHCHGPKKQPCKGIHIVFPDGKNHHTSYPFGMHSERSIPWNYKVHR